MYDVSIDRDIIRIADEVNYLSTHTYEYEGVDGRTYQCEEERDPNSVGYYEGWWGC